MFFLVTEISESECDMIIELYKIRKEVIDMGIFKMILTYLFSTDISKTIFGSFVAAIIKFLMKSKEHTITEAERTSLENKRKIYKKLYYEFCINPISSKKYNFNDIKEKLSLFFNNEYIGNDLLYDTFSSELQRLIWKFISEISENNLKNIQDQIIYEYRDLCKKLGYGALPELGTGKYSHSEKFLLSGNFCMLFAFFSAVFINTKIIGTICLMISLGLGAYTFYEYFRFIKNKSI